MPVFGCRRQAIRRAEHGNEIAALPLFDSTRPDLAWFYAPRDGSADSWYNVRAATGRGAGQGDRGFFAYLKQRAATMRVGVEILESRCLMSSAGTLVKIFGNAGSVTVPQDFQAATFSPIVAVASNGGILVTDVGRRTSKSRGDSVILWFFNPNGSLDQKFGSAGQLTLPLPASAYVVSNPRVQTLFAPDGGILVCVGNVLYRLNSNGSTDQSFGSKGSMVLKAFAAPTNGYEEVSDIAVDSQGRIYVVGFGGKGSTYDLIVQRFLSNGRPDTSFAGGKFINKSVTAPAISSGALFFHIGVLSTGEVELAGLANPSEPGNGEDAWPTYDYVSVRLDTTGKIVRSNGNDGRG